MYKTTQALEPLIFMSTKACPKWLFDYNCSTVCPALLMRRAQNVPDDYMPHHFSQCQTPYCISLSRFLLILSKFDEAVNADVVNWDLCTSLLVDSLLDIRKQYVNIFNDL